MEVVFPEEQTCCGQPMSNAGVADAAAPLARTVLDYFLLGKLPAALDKPAPAEEREDEAGD